MCKRVDPNMDVVTMQGMPLKICSKNMKTACILLSGILFIFANGIVQAQPDVSDYTTSSKMLQDYLEALSDEVPPQSAINRIEGFDEKIRYFSQLTFTRRGVGVDANFLRALVAAESAGNPNAISHKNAIGLSQITIETGRVAARELYDMEHDFDYVDRERLRDLQPSDLHDPGINLLIAAYLLDRYNYEFNNNLALTVSAWNAGPGAVTRFHGYPPYDETMTLIARVESYYHYFRRKYPY